MSDRIGRILMCVLATAFVLLVARRATAETLQAPVSGKAISLGDRVVCGALPAGWSVEREGRAVRPPLADDAIGRAGEIHVAPASLGCAGPIASVTLIATGRFPA